MKMDFNVISKDEGNAKVEIIYDDKHSEVVVFPIVSINELRSMILLEQDIIINDKYIEGFSYNALCLNNKKPLKNFNAKGSIFYGNSNFSDAVFEGNVSFSNSLFNGGFVDFERTVFKKGIVSFDCASFGDGGVSFQNAYFGEGDVFFRNARFGKGGVSFRSAIFGKGNVYFKSASFIDGKTEFVDTQFGDGDVSFQYANFGAKETNFTHARFGEGDVLFEGSCFRQSDVSFGDISFGNGMVSFAYSKFDGGKVSFMNSIFGDGYFCFENTVFDGDVDFLKAKFGRGDVSFRGVKFSKGKVGFFRAEFGEGNVSFDTTIFENGSVRFVDTVFGDGNVFFRDAKISNASIRFENVSFASSINRKIIFSGLKEDDISNYGEILFVECVISLSMVFDINRIRNISFKNCINGGVVDLRTVKKDNINRLSFINFHNLGAVYMNWDSMKESLEGPIVINSERLLIDEVLADEMKMLKENFHNQGYYDWEDEAYVKYMNHHCNTISPFRGTALKVFGMVGGYGTKPLRVSLWMFCIILFFGFLYMVLGPQSITGNVDSYHFWSPFYYSAITFLTVGYGDLAARTGLTAVLAGIEGFLGVFLMSYFSVSLVRKTLR